MIKNKGRTRKSRGVRKQNISAEDQTARFKELEVPESARQAHHRLVTMFEEGLVTCGRVFVDRVMDVVDMEKTVQEQNFHSAPERGRRFAELPDNVSRKFLEKCKLYFSLLDEPVKKTTNKPIDTRLLTALLRQNVGAIKLFLNFKEEDIRKLTTLGREATRAFFSLHKRFPENLDSFGEFYELFGKDEGKIPPAYLSQFTSMHKGKGHKELVTRTRGFWDWIQGKGWTDLFSSISGLLNSKGIPASDDPILAELETFMALFVEGENSIPGKYRTCFTSMQNGKGIKGLTSKTTTFWKWIQEKGWEDYVPSISALLNGKGIPETGSSIWEELETFIALFGESDNQIPSKYRSCFTSMQSCKGSQGLTSKAATFWTWIQEKGWEDCVSSISGLIRTKGIPEPGSSVREELEIFMALFGEGENSIPTKYRTCFTSMHNGKGTRQLVEKAQSFWDWVDRDARLLREAARLNNIAGIPDISTLNKTLDRLNRVMPSDNYHTVSVKMIALHVTAPLKKKLPLPVVQSFIEKEESAGRGSGMIPLLAKLLRRHGENGVQAYQDIMGERDSSDVSNVAALFQKAQTVELARMAVTKILPHEGFMEAKRYLVVCRTLSLAPDFNEWQKIKRYIKVLCQTINRNYNDSDDGENKSAVTPLSQANNWFIQGEYIASLWTLPETLKERFLQVNSVQSLLRVVRSITALKRLSCAGSGENFRQQCETCLNTAVPILSARDMVNLFQIHRTLRISWYQQQRDFEGDFSQVSTDASGTGILIQPASGKNGKSLWQPFVAAVIDGLYESNVGPGGQGAKIILPGEFEELVLPSPRLTFNEQGVSITNWTEEQYRLFADSLELPGFESEDTPVSEHDVNRRHHRTRDTAFDNKSEPKNLSFRLIEQKLKSPVPLKRKTWSQLDDLLQQPILAADTLKLLRPLADDMTAAQLTDVVARMDINLSWEERSPWMEKLCAIAMPRNNAYSWDVEDWQEDDILGTVPAQPTDEPGSLSLVPVWRGGRRHW